MSLVGRLADGPGLLRRCGRPIGAALLTIALVACTGDDGDGGSAGTEPDRAVEVPGEAVEGGTIRLGIAGPVVVDPATANPGSPSDLMTLDLLHDGLVKVGPDGEVQPALASSWRDNGKSTAFAFVLDGDATFASGTAITAEHAVASIHRVVRGGDTSLAALRLESVKGFRAFVEGTADTLAGVTVRDDEVYVQLDEPLATLPQILAAPEFGIVDVDGLADAQDAEGLAQLDLSGSWAVTGAEDDTLALERREGASGYLEGIELRSFDDADDAYGAFDDGDLDWALVPASRVGDAVDAYGDDHFAPFHAELFFGLRVSAEPFNEGRLRQAIAAAIDAEAIVDAVYADRAIPLSGVVPAGVPGHQDDACEPCGHDPDRAERLLAQAYPDGNVPTVAVDFDESPTQEAMAEIVADDLEAVGIPTTLRPRPLEEYKRFVVSGDQRLFSFGWIGGYLSPAAYLNALFVSDSDDNLTGVASPNIDGPLAAAVSGAGDAMTRWAEVESHALDRAVVVPIAQFRTQPVVAERVQGLAHAVDGSVDWAAVWLADAG